MANWPKAMSPIRALKEIKEELNNPTNADTAAMLIDAANQMIDWFQCNHITYISAIITIKEGDAQ